jgi:soluble lytic murein transglycosylase-like protein
MNSIRTLLCLAILAVLWPSTAFSNPYLGDIRDAAERWSVNVHELQALLSKVSNFEAGNSRSQVGIARFSGIAAKEVARLAKLSKFKDQLSTDSSLRNHLQHFDLSRAKNAKLAIEATALWHRHLLDTYGNSKESALTHYKDGRLKGLAVKRHGLGGAAGLALVSGSSRAWVDAIIGKAKDLANERPIGQPPVAREEDRSTPTAPVGPIRPSPNNSSKLPAASEETKRHWITSAPRRYGSVRLIQQDPRLYDPLIKRAAKRWNIDVNTLRGLIQAESRFDPRARSHTGAAGMGQFTGVAIAEIKRLAKMNKYAFGFTNDAKLKETLMSFDKTKAHTPLYGIEGTALYLKYVLDRYKTEESALTAYNAGHKMARLVEKYGSHAKAKAAGVLNFSQAKSYAPKVLKYKKQFKSGQWPGVSSDGITGALGQD